MPNNEIFSGIPSLDDTQGLENLLNNQALQGMGLNTQTPSALDVNQDDGSQQVVNTTQDGNSTTYNFDKDGNPVSTFDNGDLITFKSKVPNEFYSWVDKNIEIRLGRQKY